MILNKDYQLPETVTAQIEELIEDVRKFDNKELEEAETYVEFITMVKELEAFLSKSIQVVQSAMRQEVPFENFMGAIGLLTEVTK